MFLISNGNKLEGRHEIPENAIEIEQLIGSGYIVNKLPNNISIYYSAIGSLLGLPLSTIVIRESNINKETWSPINMDNCILIYGPCLIFNTKGLNTLEHLSSKQVEYIESIRAIVDVEYREAFREGVCKERVTMFVIPEK